MRRVIRVNTTPEKAFEVFTAGMTRWWIRSHSINASPQKEVVVEPRVGGRWLERGEDGSECQWGHVIAWEPPSRLVLAWQINGRWQFDPDLVTEVEVRFAREGDATLVEFEHRYLERLGEGAEQVRGAFESPQGWGGLLDRFAEDASTAT